jgi:hypothetical protein
VSWLDEIGVLTEEHREERAKALSRRASRRKWELREELWSELRVAEAVRWYESRARGQRERIARVQDCGSETLRISCTSCGQCHERAVGCRIGVLCVKCRGAIAQLKRAVFLSARADVLSDAKARGLLDRWRRKGGPYGEKFLTLTAPHVQGDSIAGRIERIFDAWPRFLKLLNQYFDDHVVRSAEWLRVFEWTIGGDECGHPHIHIWIFSPFLPFELLREWWATALRGAGCALEPSSDVIIHIQKIEGEDGGARELIKYLTKDITSNGEKLSPALYAEVYKALDGRRIVQGSSGFIARAERAAKRCDCGADLPLDVRRVRKVPPPREAPP